MDRDSYWQEVINLVKHHKQSSNPVEQLPEEKMEQLESNVYAHIDQLFSNSDTTPAIANSELTTTDSQQKSQPKKVNSLRSQLFQNRRTRVLATATFALFSVGVLVFLLSDKRLTEPLYDIPESVVAADVDRYIQLPHENLRALAGTVPSVRRSAFMAGVTQADLDLIGDIETPIAHQIALWYHHTTTNSPTIDAPKALKTVQASVSRFSADEQSRLWLKHGYLVEVVHLAAKRSMADLNTTALIDALRFYRMHALMPEPYKSNSSKAEPSNSEEESSHADIPAQYIYNHEKLIDAGPAQLITPEQVQKIVDMTHKMKVLIQ